MPEVVASFIEERDFKRVREIQKQLIDYYEQDFSKHSPKEIIARWQLVPMQLAKENKKFFYGQIKTGAQFYKLKIFD